MDLPRERMTTKSGDTHRTTLLYEISHPLFETLTRETGLERLTGPEIGVTIVFLRI